MRIRNILIVLIMVLAVGLVAGCNKDTKKTDADSGKEKGVQVSGAGQGQDDVATTGAQSRIAFEKDLHDFGKIEKGDKLTHIFEFRNEGDKELIIENISTTCGCTAAVTSSKNIAPGKTGTVSVTLDAGRLQGSISKSVIINTNDPKHRVVRLYVKALVAVDVEVNPSALFFGKVNNDQELTKQIILIDHMDKDSLEITKIEAVPSNKYISWKMEKIDDKKTRIDVTLKKGAPLGNFHSQLVFHTNSTKQPGLKANIRATIQGDIEINPERISFGIVKAGEQISKTVNIFDRKNKNFKITKVTCTSSFILTELVKVDKGYNLTVTVPENISEKQRISGAVEIHTNNKAQPTVSVPFYGVIREQGQDEGKKASAPLSGK